MYLFNSCRIIFINIWKCNGYVKGQCSIDSECVLLVLDHIHWEFLFTNYFLSCVGVINLVYTGLLMLILWWLNVDVRGNERHQRPGHRNLCPWPRWRDTLPWLQHPRMPKAAPHGQRGWATTTRGPVLAASDGGHPHPATGGGHHQGRSKVKAITKVGPRSRPSPR